MARNTFMLNNDGDSIALVKGDYYVNGGAGAQQLLINSGVTGIEIAGGMERVDFAYNSSDLAFKVNGLQIQILNGSNVIATISTNDAAGGTELAFKNGGLKISLDSSDPQNPAFSLTGANGSSQSIPLTQTNNVSLDKSFILNSSLTSNVGGNAGGGDEPTEPTGITVQEYKDHVAAGTLPDSYNLVDEAKSLAGASYAAVTGAKSITLKDDVTDLTSKANADAVKTATGMATNVVVEDSLNNLLGATLPDFGKPTTLLVNKIDSTNISLSDVTIEKAAGAQAELDAFLARTDVAYKKGLEKPGSLNLSTVTIKDTAANIIAAADDATLKTVLADADFITVGDTMKGISSVALSFVDMVNAIAVEDTLANFVAAKPTKTLLKTLAGAGTTFTATDAPDDNSAVTVDIAGLMGFNAVTNASISFANAGVTTLNLTSSTALGKDSAFTLDTANFFASFGGTVNFTASSQADDVSIASAFDTIDLGAGDDTIALGAAAVVNTVNLGEGANTLTITSGAKLSAVNGGSGKDTITLTNLASTDSVTVNGKGGADTITLSDANETVVLGDGVDLTKSSGSVTSATESSATLISSFTASATGAIKDKIAFTGDLAKMLDTSSITDSAFDASSSKHGTIAGNKINYSATADNMVTADKVADFESLFHASDNGKMDFLTKGQEAILVTKSATPHLLNVWYLKGGAEETAVTDDTIVLLGTVAAASGAITLADECFTTI